MLYIYIIYIYVYIYIYIYIERERERERGGRAEVFGQISSSSSTNLKVLMVDNWYFAKLYIFYDAVRNIVRKMMRHKHRNLRRLGNEHPNVCGGRRAT